LSSRLPRITAKELIRLLKKNGFILYDSKGSHQHYIHPVTKQKTTVPVHSGKIIGLGLLKAILNQAGLEWI
jgi:predicted RNA binding protein YcfA (HicA-like mRNA interferase family)